jgi:hypothetical protein
MDPRVCAVRFAPAPPEDDEARDVSANRQRFELHQNYYINICDCDKFAICRKLPGGRHPQAEQGAKRTA